MRLQQERQDAAGEQDTLAAHETTFRRHYIETYGPDGEPYQYYEPAYQYGYGLARSGRYSGWGWPELEAEAQRGWSGDNWQSIKDAVRHAWQETHETITGEQPAGENPTFNSLKEHYDRLYAARGYSATEEEPAYRYGYYLAADEASRDYGWQEVEPEVHRHWESQGTGLSWEQFYSVAQAGWEDARQMLRG